MNLSRFRTIPYLLLFLPFDVIVVLVLAFAEIVVLPMRLGRSPRSSNPTPASPGGVSRRRPTATIQILNWDGRHLLEECLPSVIDAVAEDGGAHEILVVDNGSTDGSVEFLLTDFPEVRVLALDRNYGFAAGNNRGVTAVRTDVVVLLNNDMVVDRGFLSPLLDGFQDDDVFAVTSQIFFADAGRRREETGKTRGRFEHGFFYLWHDDIGEDDLSRQTIPVFWAGGGSCAVDRRKFQKIGGLDELYAPFYVEDTDLSYQAWKRGWKCLLAPASEVIHKHRGTSRPKFGNNFVDNTIRKNQFLLIWKNVTDLRMICSHLWNLPRIHAAAMMQHDPGFEIRAYLRAVSQLPEVILKRFANFPHYVRGDRDVLKLSQ